MCVRNQQFGLDNNVLCYVQHAETSAVKRCKCMSWFIAVWDKRDGHIPDLRARTHPLPHAAEVRQHNSYPFLNIYDVNHLPSACQTALITTKQFPVMAAPVCHTNNWCNLSISTSQLPTALPELSTPRIAVANPVRRIWDLRAPLSTDQALGFDNIRTDSASEGATTRKRQRRLFSSAAARTHRCRFFARYRLCITSDMFRL